MIFDYLIAIDWGSTNWRAFLLNAAGQVCATQVQPYGIQQIVDKQYAAVLERTLQDWLNAYPQCPIILSGMIGSQAGWQEVPYVNCPADIATVVGHLGVLPPLKNHPIFIVPGVSYTQAGLWDVMRGEETQILGAEQSDAALFCLPGTHSKWVTWDGQRMTQFVTAMTGEVYALLRQHSLLSAVMTEDVFEPAAFQAGLVRSADSRGLLTELFSVRTAGLFKQWPASALSSYLSGILIGHEVSSQVLAAKDQPLYLIASTVLTQRYMTACDFYGRKADILNAETITARGLFLIASQAQGK